MRAGVAISAYVLLLGSSLARLLRRPGFAAGEAVAMVVLGFVLSAAAFAATRGGAPRPLVVRHAGRELTAITAYLVVFAVGFLGWGLSAVRGAVTSEPARSIAVLAAKLATMVVLPAALLVFVLGVAPRDLLRFDRPNRVEKHALLVMGALLLALQLVAGRGPKMIAELPQPAWTIALATPLALAWMCLEAGLTEEFLFRAAFQTRAAAWLRSEVAAIVAMALLFGLAHAPGYVLRGAHVMEGFVEAPDPLTAAAYSIAVVSPVGLAFGVLWSRTRSLALVVLLHGWGDLVPNLGEFVRAWLP